jgi:hypothetical protein
VRIRRRDDEDKTPEAIRPFVALGFDPSGVSGKELFGNCILCGADGKFYVNQQTAQWSCKKCSEEGNLATMLEKYAKHCRKEFKMPGKRVNSIAEHRGLPAVLLVESGLFYDGERYIFPVRNQKGNIVNYRRFRPAKKLKIMGLPGISNGLWGVEGITKDTKKVYITEGEWDCLAMRQLLIDADLDDELESEEIAVIAVPGAGTWQPEWNRFVEGKHVVLVYDKDDPGRKGRNRVFDMLGGKDKRAKRKVEYVEWPDELPMGWDLRDFYKGGGTLEILEEMLTSETSRVVTTRDDDTPKYEGPRPKWDQVIDVYRKWLLMTDAHEDALRIIYGAILSNIMPGDPLWLYLIASPGSGKTELLMSTSECFSVVTLSSVSPHSLVSGFQNHGGEDPSTIGQLIGNVCIIKDFTEILDMPKAQRDEVYSILRGAYDGEVVRRFGNGVVREYRGYFTLLAGVTHAIDGDSDSSMGERFLKYRMGTHTVATREKLLFETLRNVGREVEMKAELTTIAAAFLDIDPEDVVIPEVPTDVLYRLVALAELVAVLRTTVSRETYARERIRYKPGVEVGTRIAKQLKRLLMGLSLIHDKPRVTETDVDLVCKVAMDSCLPFHLDVIRFLLKNPGSVAEDIAKGIGVPLSTLRECLENMTLVGDEGVIYKERDDERLAVGRKPFKWYVVADVKAKWKKAGI